MKKKNIRYVFAAIVVFHLPTLYESFPTTLEKSEGQLWVGWKLTNEPNIIETVDTVWERLFDLHLNYPYKCYWECTTTHERNAVSIAEKYNLLEYLTVLFRKVDFMLIGT